MTDIPPLRLAVDSSAPVAASEPLPAGIQQSAHLLNPILVAARQLGVMLNVGLRTIRTWDSSGRLPEPVRIGGKVLWRVEEINAWLDNGAPDRERWEIIKASRKIRTSNR